MDLITDTIESSKRTHITLITTSHRPTGRVRTLSHDLERVLPGSLQINRGKLNFRGVVEDALIQGADRVILLERWKGAPGKIELYVLKPEIQRYFPLIYLASVRLQDELQGRIPFRGRLTAIMNEEASLELKNIGTSLANFLRISLVTSEQDAVDSAMGLIIEADKAGIIITFKKLPSRIEIGPRLVVKNLVWSDKG
jgi:rRNA maturation protein Rpf1